MLALSPQPINDRLPDHERLISEAINLPSSSELSAQIVDKVAQANPSALPAREVFDNGDVTLEDSPATPQDVLQSYVQEVSEKFADQQWWSNTEHVLRRKNFPDDVLKGARRLQKMHAFTVEVNGEPDLSSQINLYECGSDGTPLLSEDELEHIQNVYTLMDQLSSGLLLRSPNAQNLVLLEGLDLTAPGKDHVDFLGSASDTQTILNIRGIREMSAKYGVDFKAALSVTLAHEVLGHQLERLIEGKGEYFKRYFDYSDEMDTTQGNRVHARITAKHAVGASSQPVRRYGRKDSAEDLTTSVENVWVNAFGLAEEIKKIPYKAYTDDAYRAELVRQLLSEAAVKSGASAEGGVSTPIRYQRDAATDEYTIQPARKLTHHEIAPQQMLRAVEQEGVHATLEALSQKQEITYTLSSNAVW